MKWMQEDRDVLVAGGEVKGGGCMHRERRIEGGTMQE